MLFDERRRPMSVVTLLVYFSLQSTLFSWKIFAQLFRTCEFHSFIDKYCINIFKKLDD